MKEIKKNKLCHYCLGCNKLELESFNGVYRCNNFIQAMENWREKYNDELRKKGKYESKIYKNNGLYI